jgi:YhcN/YlaJ family sporulation lipoprotein
MNMARTALSMMSVLLVTSLLGCSPQSMPKVTKEQTPQQNADANAQKSSPAERNPNRAQVGELRKPDYSVRAPQIQMNTPQDNKSWNQKADEIAATVTRVPGVQRAAVLFTGKTALIGVDLRNDISGSKIDSIKFAVKEAAEHMNGGNNPGYRAVVTADIDTVTRTRELVAGVRAGKPVTSVSDEIADILSRLLPEM